MAEFEETVMPRFAQWTGADVVVYGQTLVSYQEFAGIRDCPTIG
jgi:hypothetical protein